MFWMSMCLKDVLFFVRTGSCYCCNLQHATNAFTFLILQSLAVDQKWVGAPFSAVLRRHQSDYCDPNDKILQVVLVLLASSSMVKQIKYLSIILQVHKTIYL